MAMTTATSFHSGRNTFSSTDHKVIGIHYAITRPDLHVLRLLADDADALPARLSEKEIVVFGFHFGKLLEKIFGPAVAGGIMRPEFYNSLGAMLGTVMVFLGIVPTAFAAFGNYVVPLQIGANDMAFPKRTRRATGPISWAAS